MGRVDFVIGLDSGAGDYERLWLTTSLRGIAAGTLSVEVLNEGVHSGDASGVVPLSFRIARRLLDRLEDSVSGRILPAAFHAPIPDERVAQARVASGILGETMVKRFPWSGRTRPMVDEQVDVVLNGHDHDYERTKPMRANQVAASPAEGTIYVVSGGAGAELYENGSDFWTQTSASLHSATVLRMRANQLVFEAFDQTGAAVDAFMISRP